MSATSHASPFGLFRRFRLPFSRSSPEGNRSPHRSLRIVVADDDRDTVFTLMTLLQHAGHETRAVYSGKDVEDVVRSWGADVVLLDIGMPGKSGYAVASSLREACGHATPLLIAVTAWDTPRDRILAERVGFHYHIAKPYDPQEILALLNTPNAKLTYPVLALFTSVTAARSAMSRLAAAHVLIKQYSIDADIAQYGIAQSGSEQWCVLRAELQSEVDATNLAALLHESDGQLIPSCGHSGK